MDNQLVDREWMVGATPNGDQLSVLQWNCLADWASDSFPRVSPEFLGWKYRRPMIVAECLRADPDIICLQEVDHFEELKSQFSSTYDSHFKRKGKSNEGRGKDGAAIFWKRDRIVANGFGEFHYWEMCQRPEMGQVLLTCSMELQTASGKCSTIQILTTHLKAKKGFDEQRNLQCEAMANYLDAGSQPHDLTLICGDFNTDADSTAVSKKLLAATKSMSLKSVYRTVGSTHHGSNSEPEWTTWKIREQVKKTTIDFIFYDQRSSWQPVDVWQMPSDDQIDDSVALPCGSYPSDHCSLAAKFELKRQTALRIPPPVDQ